MTQKLADFNQYITAENNGGRYFDEVVHCPADREVVSNPQFCSEYADTIYTHCKNTEFKNVAAAGYIERN